MIKKNKHHESDVAMRERQHEEILEARTAAFLASIRDSKGPETAQIVQASQEALPNAVVTN